MVAICTTAVSLKFGSGGWGAQNATLLNWIIVLAITGAVVMAIIYFATSDSEIARPAQIEVKDSNTVGRDNSGKMISHVENYYEAQGKEPSAPVALLQPPPVINTDLPVLRLSFSGGSVAVSDLSVEFVESGGDRCYSIQVHNMEAEAGHMAHRADSITARLTFKDNESPRVISVDRACWIGKIENEIYLQPGDTKHVLLGIPSRTKEWVTYDNPNQFVPEWPNAHRYLQEVKWDVLSSTSKQGEISIISHKNNKSITLAKRGFVITVSDANVFLNIRWQDEI